ncbi:solute carrier family 35 member b1 [Anaeramoeba flamelloides]|uniref:Solute carrier family 35 member b1 n=1 Tax=Anaeramoeba flamelloides TaxID=1746091 RepID=A0AAV7YH37_9EUKA|nr:solute carrier family 35 member b1 [Anaeramoeba flamelloides]KAJ6254110.1 solute carrier family 35 member b1 [Anaeramoeba flamelloides]
MISKQNKLIITVCGIYFFFWFFGGFHESLLSHKIEGSSFHFTIFWVFSLSFCNCLFGLAGYLIESKVNIQKRHVLPQNNIEIKELLNSNSQQIPKLKFIPVAAINLFSHLCGYHAFQLTQYPTQILVKSCKPVAVLVLGIVIFKRRYSKYRIMCILGMTLGICVFRLSAISLNLSEDSSFGFLLISFALIADGIFGPFLDHLKRAYASTTQFWSMAWLNFWICLFSFLISLLFGNFFHYLFFFFSHPTALLKLVICGVCQSSGQLFLYYGLHHFESLIISIITTTRKFFTIFYSIFFFKHKISFAQLIGIFLVFASLITDITYAKKKDKEQMKANTKKRNYQSIKNNQKSGKKFFNFNYQYKNMPMYKYLVKKV